MDEPKPILCELGPLEVGANRQRIQVFPGPGDYNHPSAGPFTLTADRLAEYVDDINSRDSIPIDRDHAFAKRQQAPAAGWFVQGTARVETDGSVTAEAEWTAKAANEIRGREYRYISPEFSFQKRKMDGNRVPEPTLDAASLTNRPFFETMEAVAAENDDDLSGIADSVLADAVESGLILACDALDALADEDEDLLTVLASKMQSKAPYGNVTYADPGYQSDGKKRYPIDTEEHIRAAWSYISKAKNGAKYSSAQLSRIKARIKRAMTKIGAKVGADATPSGGNMDDLTALAETLGIAADASEEDVLEAAKRVAAENAELKAKQDESDDQMKKLIADASLGAKAATELAEIKRDTAVKTAVDEGRIVAAEAEFYTTLYDKDPEGVAKLLADKPVLTGFTPVGSPDARVYDASGKAMQVGDDGEPITADLTPVMVDGSEIPVDEHSAKVVAATNEILRAQGITEPTAAQFAAAADKAIETIGATR